MNKILTLILVLITASCEYENVESKMSVKYSKHIAPIIQARCSIAGCHINGDAPGDFTKFIELKEKIETGKVQLMVFELELMPPITSQPLTEEERDLLNRWIMAGASE